MFYSNLSNKSAKVEKEKYGIEGKNLLNEIEVYFF